MHQKLNEAFPIVAAALGHRLGVRVMVQGQTARTDGEMIVIPAYDGNNPHYRDVAWGYLAHEAAHIRYTDFGVFKSACTSPLRKAILNIIEDIRIEKRMAESYPGTRFTIEKTVAQLISEGGYEMPSDVAHPAVLLQAYLLFGLRSQVLGQTLLKGMAKDAKDRIQQLVPSKVFDLLETISTDVDMLKDTQEALSLTDRILLMFEDELKQVERDSMSTFKSQEESDSDPSEPDDCLSAEAGRGESDQGTDSSSVDENGTLESLAGRTSCLRQLLSADDSDLNDDLFDKIREGLALGNEETARMTLPVADEPPLDPVQGRLLLEKALADSGKLRASLQGLVQAHRLSKPVTRRSGNRMDSHRLNRLALNDPRVFRRMENHKAPNTAVHILVDRSPSMSALVAHGGKTIGRRIDLAWEATLSLVIALEGIHGVNVGITAFPGKDGEASSVYAVLPHGVSVRSRVAAFGGDLDGSTPMAEAILYAGLQLSLQRQERKKMLIVTDGIPDDIVSTTELLNAMRLSNIEVIGIGFGIHVDRIFDRAIYANSLKDLKDALLASYVD